MELRKKLETQYTEIMHLDTQTLLVCVGTA